MPVEPGLGIEIDFDLLGNHLIGRVSRSAIESRRVNR